MGILNCPKLNRLLRNKCCIVCILIFFLLGGALIGAKLYINAILNESEEESFGLLNSTLPGETWENHPMEIWQPPEDIRKGTPYTFAGYDFQNRPVWILPFGTWNVKELLNAREENEKLMQINSQQFVYRVERSMTLTNSSEWALIVDMDQYSYSQLLSMSTIKFLLKMSKKFEPAFVSMAYGFILNMDYVSQKFVGMLMGSFMARMEPEGTDSEIFVPKLLTKIPANQLPSKYGGSDDYRPVAVYN